jgi:hypothetical protein
VSLGRLRPLGFGFANHFDVTHAIQNWTSWLYEPIVLEFAASQSPPRARRGTPSRVTPATTIGLPPRPLVGTTGPTKDSAPQGRGRLNYLATRGRHRRPFCLREHKTRPGTLAGAAAQPSAMP